MTCPLVFITPCRPFLQVRALLTDLLPMNRKQPEGWDVPSKIRFLRNWGFCLGRDGSLASETVSSQGRKLQCHDGAPWRGHTAGDRGCPEPRGGGVSGAAGGPSPRQPSPLLTRQPQLTAPLWAHGSLGAAGRGLSFGSTCQKRQVFVASSF